MKFGDNVDFRIYNLDTVEFVCNAHINDDFIHEFITSVGRLGKCNYCNKRRKVVELSEVLKLIITGIDHLFEDPNEFKYYDDESETGFDGDNFYFNELFYDRLDLEITDTKLSNDIFDYLDNDSLYYLKDEYWSHSEYLSDLWNHFKAIVKHRARYVFYYENVFRKYNLGNPIGILASVQESIQKFSLFRTLHASKKLYRCRQHQLKNEVKHAADLSSPPDHICKAFNRMSAVGISMFYCSTNGKVCIDEVVDENDLNKRFYTTGYFTSKSDLNLVDLTNLPSIPSIYDAQNNMYREILFFLKEFIKDISKPVNPADSSIEYVPTQIVTEYIRFNPNLKADGIIYPSSKGNSLENIVLFKNQDESLSDLTFHPKSLKTKRIT